MVGVEAMREDEEENVEAGRDTVIKVLQNMKIRNSLDSLEADKRPQKMHSVRFEQMRGMD